MSSITQTLSSAAYFAVVLLTLALTPTSFAQTQKLEIWTSGGCPGAADFTFLESKNETTPTAGNLYYKQQGLWSVEFCRNSSSCEKRNILHSTATTGCKILSGGVPSPGTYPTMIVTRFGPANQNEKNIYFYPGEELTGTALEIGEDGVNEINANVFSYYFAGSNQWLINNETCIDFAAPGRMTYFSWRTQRSLTSVKLGCDPTTIPTTPVTTPVTVTESQTTTPEASSTTPRNCTGDATCDSGASVQVNISAAAFVAAFAAVFALSSS